MRTARGARRPLVHAVWAVTSPPTCRASMARRSRVWPTAAARRAGGAGGRPAPPCPAWPARRRRRWPYTAARPAPERRRAAAVRRRRARRGPADRLGTFPGLLRRTAVGTRGAVRAGAGAPGLSGTAARYLTGSWTCAAGRHARRATSWGGPRPPPRPDRRSADACTTGAPRLTPRCCTRTTAAALVTRWLPASCAGGFPGTTAQHSRRAVLFLRGMCGPTPSRRQPAPAGRCPCVSWRPPSELGRAVPLLAVRRDEHPVGWPAATLALRSGRCCAPSTAGGWRRRRARASGSRAGRRGDESFRCPSPGGRGVRRLGRPGWPTSRAHRGRHPTRDASSSSPRAAWPRPDLAAADAPARSGPRGRLEATSLARAVLQNEMDVAADLRRGGDPAGAGLDLLRQCWPSGAGTTHATIGRGGLLRSGVACSAACRHRNTPTWPLIATWPVAPPTGRPYRTAAPTGNASTSWRSGARAAAPTVSASTLGLLTGPAARLTPPRCTAARRRRGSATSGPRTTGCRTRRGLTRLRCALTCWRPCGGAAAAGPLILSATRTTRSVRPGRSWPTVRGLRRGHARPCRACCPPAPGPGGDLLLNHRSPRTAAAASPRRSRGTPTPSRVRPAGHDDVMLLEPPTTAAAAPCWIGPAEVLRTVRVIVAGGAGGGGTAAWRGCRRTCVRARHGRAGCPGGRRWARWLSRRLLGRARSTAATRAADAGHGERYANGLVNATPRGGQTARTPLLSAFARAGAAAGPARSLSGAGAHAYVHAIQGSHFARWACTACRVSPWPPGRRSTPCARPRPVRDRVRRCGPRPLSRPRCCHRRPAGCAADPSARCRSCVTAEGDVRLCTATALSS